MVAATNLPAGLDTGATIRNPLSKDVYLLGDRLGKGGFGTAFKASRLVDGEPTEVVCLKVTRDSGGWHGEAFLGEFLHNSPRAVRVHDAFPFIWESGRQRKRRTILFALASELMTRGTVSDWCTRPDEPAWPEARVRREIRLLLATVDQLHVNGVSHRDITPGNVFLGPRSTLKLGDFGIAAMARLHRGVRANAYNAAFKPPNVTAFWTPADDLYQIGLLAMTLLAGVEVVAGVKKPAVNGLTPTDLVLRDVIKTAISSNRKERFQDADEMARALKHGP